MSQERPTLHRGALTLLPKPPALEWLSALNVAEGGKAVGRAAFLKRVPAFLIPPYVDKEELGQVLELLWEEIFETVLTAWSPDPKDWPAQRSLAMFEGWFDVVASAEVLDLARGALDENA